MIGAVARSLYQFSARLRTREYHSVGIAYDVGGDAEGLVNKMS